MRTNLNKVLFNLAQKMQAHSPTVPHSPLSFWSADQEESGLWGRDWQKNKTKLIYTFIYLDVTQTFKHVHE